MSPESATLDKVGPNQGLVSAAPSPTEAVLARIRELEAENAKLRAGPFADRTKLAHRECYFMFRRNQKHPMERIHASSDPRWAELADPEKWSRQVEGTFVIENLVRNGLKWDDAGRAWAEAEDSEPGVSVGDVVRRETETSFSGQLWSEALASMRRVERTGAHYMPDPHNVPKLMQRVVAVA